MADEIAPTTPPAPASPPPAPESEAPAGPTTAPLTPVFLVWPGKRDAGSWTLKWFGVAFVVAGLLSWAGRNDEVLSTSDGVMTRGEYELLRAENTKYEKAGREDLVRPVPTIGAVNPPRETSWGRALVLLCGLAMLGAGIVNTFQQRLVAFTPVLTSLIMVGLVLWFTFTVSPEAFQDAESGNWGADRNPVRAYSQIVPVVSNIGGLFAFPGQKAYDDMVEATTLFGPGVYVALFADVLLFLFLIITIVTAVLSAKGKDGPKAKGGSSARKRPGGRR